ETPQLSIMWNTFYTGVINTNRIIKQLEDGLIPASEGGTIESLIGEMKTVRSFYYWLLMDNFGEVPLVHAVSDELPTKSTRREIYDFIVQELETNIPLLSELKTP